MELNKKAKEGLTQFVENMNWSEYAKEKGLVPNNTTFKVLIVPSSDDERDFEEVGGYDEAIELVNDNPNKYCTSVYEFPTLELAQAFIEGYMAGVGYMGEGAYYLKAE